MPKLVQGFTFTTDETRSVSLAHSQDVGRMSVFARRTSGSGTATLAVRGSFTESVADTANTAIQITAPTSMGTGALTSITADGATPYSRLHLVYDVTGTATFEVVVVSY